MSIALAILLGTAFGFILHRVGASNPQLIVDMLRLRNLHLAKAILLGIAIASAGLFLGLTLGLIDPSHVSVKTSYWGVLAGGAILGAGWALTGYCPGTGVVAMGDGRRDAFFYVAGGLLGAFAYMLVFPMVKDTFLLDEIAGGKTTLAAMPDTSYTAIVGGAPVSGDFARQIGADAHGFDAANAVERVKGLLGGP